MRAMGRVAFRSERPFGVLGRRRRMAVLISSGTSRCVNQELKRLLRVRVFSASKSLRRRLNTDLRFPRGARGVDVVDRGGCFFEADRV